MTTLHIVSHTHWDREWYLPFQRFRLQLVHLVDHLLNLLENDPDFKHFMLDGQTIVLEDYLQVRPENEERLKRLVQSGRLLIGPWYILPDEFLVSPEAIIRNLLEGERTARRFGQKMESGYIPDPFGHIAQMPQILRGFGIDTACLQRGLADEPCEFWWEAPDGSHVWMAYLRDSYANATHLPVSNPQAFAAEAARARDSLRPHTRASHLLLMHGNDHTVPPVGTSAAIAQAAQFLPGDRIIHSTLPDFFAAVREELGVADGRSTSQAEEFPVLRGELRASKRHNLLPGVLSSRMWIKQRNHACQILLEKWAEPFSAWASFLSHPLPPLRFAWRLLLECHPHDSICGCSIDQVHEEMRSRFDQVEQIGEELTRQSLESIASRATTLPDSVAEKIAPEELHSALLVFNPVAGPRTDLVQAQLQLPPGVREFEILSAEGQVLPHQVAGSEVWEVAAQELSLKELQDLLAASGGPSLESAPFLQGLSLYALDFTPAGETLQIHASLCDPGIRGLAPEALSAALPEFMRLLNEGAYRRFKVRADLTLTKIEFVAPEVPGHGYKTFWIRLKEAPRSGIPALSTKMENTASAGASEPDPHPELAAVSGPPAPFSSDEPLQSTSIENEFFRVEAGAADGSLTLLDKRSGRLYRGLQRFVDGGDRGDEYNYCPPEADELVTARLVNLRLEKTALSQALLMDLVMDLPVGLAPNRSARSQERAETTLQSRISLYAGVPRLDFETRIDNHSSDHRLRVHFAFPERVDSAEYDGHFTINQRPVALPPFDETWQEHPRPEKPQRHFCHLSADEHGFILANRGLPEVEVLDQPGEGGSEIALTLLRCTGWLSRDDLSNRRNHAGPGLPTPGAQMLGSWDFAYSLIPYSKPAQNPLDGFHLAYAFNAPLRSAATGLHAGRLPAQGSLVEVQPATFALSAVKLAEDGSGLIVRGYNLTSEPIQVKLAPWQPFERAWLVNLAEQPQAELRVEPDGSLRFEAGAHAICSLKFEQLRGEVNR